MPIVPPATIEGGDVLRVGRTLLVGESSRTNRAGIEALRSIVGPFGYRVVRVPVFGGLHLKTCVTALDAETCLLNRAWLDPRPLAGFRLRDVDETEPWAANTLAVGGEIMVNAAFPRTADIIAAAGYRIRPLDMSEFAKAEAGLTCLSLLFHGAHEGPGQ